MDIKCRKPKCTAREFSSRYPLPLLNYRTFLVTQKHPPAPFSQYPVLHHRLAVPGFLKVYFIYFYFWVLWDFTATLRLSVVVESRAPLSSCSGFSGHGAQALGCAGSVVVAHGPSCPAACGIFPDQGSNLCPLHWQVDS